MAERIAKEVGGFYVNQFENPANPMAHETTTGPELWTQLDGKIDAVVCGVGSGGTVTGIGRYLKGKGSTGEMVLADPVGSILAPLINTGETIEPGSWLVEGIGEDFVPPILDLSLIKKAYSISDEESFAAGRDLLRKEGILAGSSSGTLLAAALKYCHEQTTPKNVVTFVCDRGDKYLSKVFSDPWIREQGFASGKGLRTVADLLARRHDDGDTIVVRESDTALTAYKRMRLADVSQLPVLDDNGKVIGLVDEDGLMRALASGVVANDPVAKLRHRDIVKIAPDAAYDDALQLLSRHNVLMVMEGDHFHGVLTKVDAINSLFRRNNQAQ
jgi:cystathionine beta-synthase